MGRTAKRTATPESYDFEAARLERDQMERAARFNPRGLVEDSFEDALAIKDYAQKIEFGRGVKERNEESPAKQVANLFSDRRIGFENRDIVHQLDPELDRLLGQTGYNTRPNAPKTMDDLVAARAIDDLSYQAPTEFNLGYCLNNWADAALLSAHPDAYQTVVDQDDMLKMLIETDDIMAQRADETTTRMMDLMSVSRVEAQMLVKKMEAAMGSAESTVMGLTDEQVIEEFFGGPRAPQEMTPELIQQAREGLTQRETETWLNDVLGPTAENEEFYKEWFNVKGAAHQTVEAAFATVGSAVQIGLGVADYFQQKWGEFSGEGTPAPKFGLTNPEMLSTLSEGVGNLPGIGTVYHPLEGPTVAREREIESLKEAMGLPNEQFLTDIMAPGLATAWFTLAEQVPEEYQKYMTDAGGDEQLARAMFYDDAQYIGLDISDEDRAALGLEIGVEYNARDLAEIQLQQYKDDVTGALQELEDSNFTISDSVMEALAFFGSFNMTLANGFASITAEVFSGSADPAAVIRRMQESTTPAEVFGIEGTLSGLMVDLFFTTMADPTVWFIGPKFATTIGVSGMSRARHIINHVVSPGAKKFREGLVDIIHSTSRGATGFMTVAAQLGEHTGAYIAAARGWSQPLLKWATNRSRKWGAVADDLDQAFLDSLGPEWFPEGHWGDDVLDAAADRLKTGEYDPAVIAINPAHGFAEIASGDDLLAAARRDGYDNFKGTLKVDEDLGMIMDPEWQRLLDKLDSEQLDPAMSQKLSDAAVADVEAAINQLTTIGDYGPVVATTPKGVQIRRADPKNLVMKGIDYDREMFVFLDEAGNPLGGVLWPKSGFGLEGSAATVARLPRVGGRHMMNDVLPTLLEIMDDDILRAALADNSFTDASMGMVRRYAETRLVPDPNLPTHDWVTRQGLERAQDVAGSQYISPRHMVPDELRYGGTPRYDVMEQIEEQVLRRGGRQLDGSSLPIAVSVGRDLAEVFGHSNWADRLADFATVRNNANTVPLMGPTAISRQAEFLGTIFGAVDDLPGLENALNRVLVVTERTGQLNLQRMALRSQIDEVLIQLRGLPELNAISPSPGIMDDPALLLNQAVRDERRMLQRQLDDLRQTQRELFKEATDNADGQALLDEIMEQWNRDNIGSHPDWAEFADETGFVPWEHLSPRNILTDQFLEKVLIEAQEKQISLAKAARELSDDLEPQMLDTLEQMDAIGKPIVEMLESFDAYKTFSAQYQLPLSPIELITAAKGGPNALQKWMAREGIMRARRWFYNMHTAFLVDKVMTPRTGIVVATDELTRMAHGGGVFANIQWMEDRLMYASERLTRALNSRGYIDLPTRWRERFAELGQTNDYLSGAERNIIQEMGYETTELSYNPKYTFRQNVDYYRAAQQRASRMIDQEGGFAAFLEGEDAFRTWFETSDEALFLRETDYFSVVDMSRRGFAAWEEMYQGFQSVFENALRKIPESKRAKAMLEWKRAAERAANGGSRALPMWVLEGFGSVTGAAVVPEGFLPGAINRASGIIFDAPMRARQAFTQAMIRKSEWKRLERLMADQNIEILTDTELLNLLKTKHPQVHERYLVEYLPQVADELFDEYNVISRRQLHDQVEHYVEMESEKMLYALHRQSQLGTHTRAVFPFGRPWADMWGHWGRQLIERPQLRGWVNNTNFLNLNQIANGLLDAMPVNPRTLGMVSRLANTDFDLENVKDDPLFGWAFDRLPTDSFDMSGALFLPTKGAQPFLIMLPGLGIVPAGIATSLMEGFAPDPAAEPQAYQTYMQQMQQIHRGLGYNRPPDFASWVWDSFVGGGVTGRFMGAAGFANMLLGNTLQSKQDSITADYKTSVAQLREARVTFSDPEIWNELAELTTEFMGLGLQAMANTIIAKFARETAQTVGQERLLESGMEFLLPVSADTMSQTEALDDVWIAALEYLPFSDVFKNRLDLNSNEGREEAAGRIAGEWYQMPQSERDFILLEHPELYVNMISSWRWTDDASQSGYVDTQEPYHTDGSTEGQAIHQNMIRLGMIRPMTVLEFITAIVGTKVKTEERAAKTLYEDTAAQWNDLIWEGVVDESWKNTAATLIELLGDELPYDTPEDLWRNWTGQRELIWELMGRPMDEETGDRVLIPGPNEAAWNERFPSSLDDLRDEFAGGFPIIEVTDEMASMASALGWDLNEDTTMRDLYDLTAAHVSETQTDNPLWLHLGIGYEAWKAPMGSGRQFVKNWWSDVLDHPDISQEARVRYTQSLMFIDNAMQAKIDGEDDWVEMANEARQMYGRMYEDDYLKKLPIDQMWDAAYGDSLGTFDWTPDEPAPLYDENGDEVDTVMLVLPEYVYDGDTITFKTAPDRTLFGLNAGGDMYSVRLLGVNAREMGEEGGREDKNLLQDAVEEAVDNGWSIQIVRDPERYGNTDFYGRVLGWLYINGEPWHRPETQIP